MQSPSSVSHTCTIFSDFHPFCELVHRIGSTFPARLELSAAQCGYPGETCWPEIVSYATKGAPFTLGEPPKNRQVKKWLTHTKFEAGRSTDGAFFVDLPCFSLPCLSSRLSTTSSLHSSKADFLHCSAPCPEACLVRRPAANPAGRPSAGNPLHPTTTRNPLTVSADPP